MKFDQIAKLVTGEVKLLEKLDTEEILQFHPLISAQDKRLVWETAQKTVSVRAKPISSILNDHTIAEKVLMETTEGFESFANQDAFLCQGPENDFWFQVAETLHTKYEIACLDPDGWAQYNPKPDFPVQCAKVDPKLFSSEEIGPEGGFSIVGPGWGAFKRNIEGHGQVDLQFGRTNDFIVQGIKKDPKDESKVVTNPDDSYIVLLKVFKNTYSVS